MVIFKTICKDASLNRQYKFQNQQHVKIRGKDVTLFEVWEMVVDTWHFIGQYSTPVGFPYKRLHTCAKNWLRNHAHYDGIEIVE